MFDLAGLKTAVFTEIWLNILIYMRLVANILYTRARFASPKITRLFKNRAE
jgi:hypothetical protein|tara:strand:- start:1709 stop:1861 length:153 start_codon:yes stop_codon:yes gene_type:complete